jgi:uncharacterized protein YodC (DUF2158 family)
MWKYVSGGVSITGKSQWLDIGVRATGGYLCSWFGRGYLRREAFESGNESKLLLKFRTRVSKITGGAIIITKIFPAATFFLIRVKEFF